MIATFLTIRYTRCMAKSRERPPIYEQHAFDETGNYREPRRLYTAEHVIQLQEALEPFVDLPDLRRCIAERVDIYEALRVDNPPRELRVIMETLAVILR